MTLSKSKNYLFWCKSCLNNSLRPRITFDEKASVMHVNGWLKMINVIKININL